MPNDINNLPPVPEAFDWERFREYGHKVIDFVADYQLALQRREIPVRSAVEPNYLSKLLPNSPPMHQSEFDEVMKNFQSHIHIGMTNWQHPDFHAWFPSQFSPPAMLGEILASSYNQPGFNWVSSPAATELEMIVMNWLCSAFGLPSSMLWSGTGGGVIQPSASEAAVVAVIGARNKVLARYKTEEEKIDAASKLVCYVSNRAHFCVEKASRIAGIHHIRKIITKRDPSNGNYPVRGAQFEELVKEDLAKGLIPCMISVNYGTTDICAVDDFEDIGKVCQKHSIWMNLDAAYAGATAICPEMRGPLLSAFEYADTVFINGSKWFSLMINASFFFFKEKQYISASLSATGAYLRNKATESGAVYDFKDYQLGLTRPFRSLKVYTTLSSFGIEGIQATIRRQCILAQYLHSLLSECEHFELPVQTKFGLVCFQIKNDPDNKLAREIYAQIDQERKIMLVTTEVDSKVLFRIVMAHPRYDKQDVENLVEYLKATTKSVIGSK